MAKEYLVVLFPRKRRVMIHDQLIGVTNTKIEIESGTYEVTLGPPRNFKPDTQNIDLSNTSSFMPMIVEFEEALR